jgi:hypothetical protein
MKARDPLQQTVLDVCTTSFYQLERLDEPFLLHFVPVFSIRTNSTSQKKPQQIAGTKQIKVQERSGKNHE